MMVARRPTLFPVSASSLPSQRDYKWSFKLYPDSTDYDIKEVLFKLQNYFHDWVWIEHDKDLLEFQRERLRVCSLDRTRKKMGVFKKPFRKFHIPLAKPHIHFYGKQDCHCRLSKQSIVKWLGLPYSYNFRPHDIEPCWSWEGCVKYTVHRNRPDKYQYPVNKARTNMYDYIDIVNRGKSMKTDLDTLYTILEDAKASGTPIPYYQLVRIMSDMGCTLQLARPSMVERISKSFQWNEMGKTVE